jgi:hypothetical protein
MRPLAIGALLLIAAATLAGCRGQEPATPALDEAALWQADPEGLAVLLQGVGLMRRFEFAEAEVAFAEAMGRHPDSRIARRNHAIAILNQSGPGAQDRAIALLGEMLEAWFVADGRKGPRDLSALYAKGLGFLYLGQPGAARDLFLECANRAPDDAYAAFFAAQCLELEGRFAEALPWYERSIELDPLLRSPLLGAQRCLDRLGRGEAGEALLERFLALAENPRGKLAEFKYTRMGALGEVRSPLPPAVVPPPRGALFAAGAAMPILGLPAETAASVRPAADLDGDGVLDFLVLLQRAGEAPSEALALSGQGEDGAWRLVPFAAGDPEGAAPAAAPLATRLWADLDNDGRVDLAISPGDGSLPSWWRQGSGLRFARLPFALATAEGEAPLDLSSFATLLAAADLDHDGDVDLLATGAAGTALLLNLRDGDGSRPTRWALRPIPGAMPGATAAILGDFDGDGLVDLMLLGEGAAQVWINELLWSWRRDDRFAPIEGSAPREGVWFRDDDGGEPMLALLRERTAGRELVVWSLDGAAPSVVGRVGVDPGAHGLAVVDLAGSGRQNLLLRRPDSSGGDGASVALEVRDARGNLVESIAGLPESISLAVPDARGVVLLAEGTAAGDPPRWWAAGPGRMPFAAVWFSGRIDPTQQMRSNASGLGTRGDARTLGAWQSRTLLPWRSGGGDQPIEPVLFGLGLDPMIEWLAIEWPDGVLQGELDIGPGVSTIAETQRQISSCPVIFAWTGERFEFLTDALGVAGIGYLADLRREADGSLTPLHPTPRPWERVPLGPEHTIAPRNGRFEIRIAEPMEESCYLDAARLVAWEVPAGWSVVLDERMGLGGPPPTGTALFHRRSVPVVRATREDGSDQTEALRAVDFVAADPGPADPRFIGRTAAEWILEFEFPQPIEGTAGDPILVIDGWVEYPYSSTNFAMWQADALPQAPTLEALDPASGAWVVLVDRYGYPAGMPRQSVFPIPRDSLPAGCTTLRWRSTNEVYFDRILLAWAEPCPAARRVEMPLVRALLADAGFARRTTKPQRRPHYDPTQPWPLWSVRQQIGFFTAFGDCTPLLAETDDAVAIFGSGEEVRLEFRDVRAPLPEGWTRSWVLELDGWCKDMDPFTGGGAALEPLPRREGSATSARREALHRQFNTRFAGGR